MTRLTHVRALELLQFLFLIELFSLATTSDVCPVFRVLLEAIGYLTLCRLYHYTLLVLSFYPFSQTTLSLELLTSTVNQQSDITLLNVYIQFTLNIIYNEVKTTLSSTQYRLMNSSVTFEIKLVEPFVLVFIYTGH